MLNTLVSAAAAIALSFQAPSPTPAAPTKKVIAEPSLGDQLEMTLKPFMKEKKFEEALVAAKDFVAKHPEMAKERDTINCFKRLEFVITAQKDTNAAIETLLGFDWDKLLAAPINSIRDSTFPDQLILFYMLPKLKLPVKAETADKYVALGKKLSSKVHGDYAVSIQRDLRLYSAWLLMQSGRRTDAEKIYEAPAGASDAEKENLERGKNTFFNIMWPRFSRKED